MKTKAREVVDKMFAFFGKQDIDAVVSTFSDDAVLIHNGTQIMPSAKFVRKEGARMFFEFNINSLEVVYFNVNEFIEAGEDRLIIQGNEHGAHMKNTWVQIYTVQHGLITKMEEFATFTSPDQYGGNAGGL